MADVYSKPRPTDFCGLPMHRLANVGKSCKSFLLFRLKKLSNHNKLHPCKKKRNSEAPKSSKVSMNKKEHNKTKTPDRITTDPVEGPRGFSSNLSNRKGHYASLSSRFSSYSQPLGPATRTMSGNLSHLKKSTSQKNFGQNSVDGIRRQPNSLSRNISSKIMYSNSAGVIKPPAVEKKLVCTLEEVCFGCIKKVKITRDVVTDDRDIVQEDNVLTIKVKPGWRNGTKITFEGMGNEVPGGPTGDVTIVIVENKHLLFRKDGDDLVFEIEIPLVEALTGCTLLVPLLDGEKTMIDIEDIIYPGYRKIVAGQGMPKSKEPGERGDLILKFEVEFPEQLTDEQRLDVYNILHNSC
ncbi:HSP40/DnaJ peptide-binding protein [Heracleum sosnowskyi]|uniref:HSP40/DnaJ peptide-binding protein n=1 Tax=Heracleum sosnowskyi TaxID=360622 RepID=A0AAD8H825_9APIA|nr:HSP40/DnaJ peptide-binding protein [Heracleum sosnowskyi]